MPFTYTTRARIRLERLKRSKIIRSYLEQQSYVRICSIRAEAHEMARYAPEDLFHAFWRKDAAGYTSNGSEAGIYTGEEAMRVSRHCGPEKQIVYDVLRQKDERTQAEMGQPSIRFKGCIMPKEPERHFGEVRFHYEVSQQLPPPAVGRSFAFDLYWHWQRDTTDALKYTVEFGDPPESLEQLARWHRACAWALENLPKPRMQIPVW